MHFNLNAFKFKLHSGKKNCKESCIISDITNNSKKRKKIKEKANSIVSSGVNLCINDDFGQKL